MAPSFRRKSAPTLPPADEKRLADSSAELENAIRDTERINAAVKKVADDIDSDRLSVDGVVLEEMSDDDSLVVVVREGLQSVQHR